MPYVLDSGAMALSLFSIFFFYIQTRFDAGLKVFRFPFVALGFLSLMLFVTVVSDSYPAYAVPLGWLYWGIIALFTIFLVLGFFDLFSMAYNVMTHKTGRVG